VLAAGTNKVKKVDTSLVAPVTAPAAPVVPVPANGVPIAK
jgi:hypothetical protein